MSEDGVTPGLGEPEDDVTPGLGEPEDDVTPGLGEPEDDVPPGDGVPEAPPEGGAPEGDGASGDGEPVSETGESEKLMTARVDRRSVFAASASARTLIGLADGPETTEFGTRRVAVRSTGVSSRSPSSHRSSWPESAFVQAGEWLVQDNGSSAVRRSTASFAIPPWARTPTAYASA
ncbi:hypothetical protein E1281_26715 [Actinomadura sp. KC345]|uniref:hypothetical protein n=1 Tax=Actinomadura sp. KC345 TaxID=2530371 RepID=UPI00104927D3|nr:hypothetical protein [Actinomadura sp. KC345]TDC47170.1 hypothetical protein E1281_26715 [Actinomadura sp. KC345]